MDKPVVHHHGLDFLKKKTKLEPIHRHKLGTPIRGGCIEHPEGAGEAQTYYWIWADDGGRKIVWGPYPTNEEAQRRAYGKLHCYFEVVPLHTRDEGTASRMLRARMLDSTGDISESFKRFKHKEE